MFKISFGIVGFLILLIIFYTILYIAVKSIKRQHLVEVRSMVNPPLLVKLALESICLLLGENAVDWKAIRTVIMKDNFINSIVSNFSTEDIRYACLYFYVLILS